MAKRRGGITAGVGLSAVAAGLLMFLGSLATAEAIIGSREEGVISIAGVLSSAEWNLSVDLPANHLLLLDIDADIYGSPLDSILQVINPGGTVIAENDDSFYSLDSALGVVIPTAGRYTIRVRDYGGGSGPDFFFLLNGSIRPVQ